MPESALSRRGPTSLTPSWVLAYTFVWRREGTQTAEAGQEGWRVSCLKGIRKQAPEGSSPFFILPDAHLDHVRFCFGTNNRKPKCQGLTHNRDLFIPRFAPSLEVGKGRSEVWVVDLQFSKFSPHGCKMVA